MSIRRVAMVVHDGKPEAAAVRREITGFLSDRGIEVTEDAPDLVVSLGGDGTMLRGAHLSHRADVPLLGVNLGTLGYLTEVEAAGAQHALDSILSGDYQVEERMMLNCETMGEEAGSYVGLNEVLVERSSQHRLVRLGVRIGGESLAAFNADGIIVATPTGSTAYALSAGGPIVSPRAECLVVVPVSAHMIFSRPFVLAPDETVEITVEAPDQEASLSLDGALGCDIAPGTTVLVNRHPRPLRLVRLAGPGFLERLRIKLDLPR
ncbi:MAG: NAD(+)/NADH kinase [Actinomycetota bacterium]|nr:NAD(+)/NADH kinase [Actinomycetota bacterium]